ncbi:hypothetical protein PF005_g20597 [Phytophthora fragariae]|uniref:Uncharacterized protein n=2 Tax=Phytophthora TaxID=4783 RepID=A0A6A3SEG5_9STRA|nr:hypothetical protein PF003_g28991 [Phytophthora fragariae]KAE9024046.1 hypothetical protein PR002_g11549 [Phytophthora rubi]KAE8928217.1 hypothetical protein PF009_g21631 [Phytophthora fragariae]KAE8988072.1 hypothetical protein PF011_g19317 [Phytophthora fragariae]KAE9030149.1 hypothetical protein PR001_g11335 [Phytophthora rubi]
MYCVVTVKRCAAAAGLVVPNAALALTRRCRRGWFGVFGQPGGWNSSGRVRSDPNRASTGESMGLTCRSSSGGEAVHGVRRSLEALSGLHCSDAPDRAHCEVRRARTRRNVGIVDAATEPPSHAPW